MKIIHFLTILIVTITTLLPLESFAQNNSEYSFNRGMEEYRAENYSSALEWFQKAVTQNPHNALANMYISILQQADNQYGLALSAINRAINSIPKKDKEMMASAYAIRGDIYVEMGDTIKGLEDFAFAIKSDQTNRAIYKNRGQIYYEQRKFDLSDADYKKMSELDPGDTMGYMGIARNAIEQKKWNDAIELLDYVIKLSPDYSSGYSFRADACLGLNKYTEAADDIIKALTINGDGKAHYLMIHADKHLYPILKAKLQIQANKDKNVASWYYYLGQLAEVNNHYKEAINYYTKGNDKDANSVSLERIADCYFALGDYNAALNFVDKGLAMAADDDDLIMSKGDILNEMGRHDEAISMLGSFIDKNPEFGYGYYRRGWYKDEKGDREGAIDDYTMAITLDPTYAYSYIGRGRDYEILGQRDLAVADYRKVIELDTVPNDNSCAQYAFLFMGEKEKAIDFMNRYLEASDSRTGGTYDAACLYSLMGDKEKALSYLEQALERGYRRFAHMAVDRDLENIRTMPKYKQLIEKYQRIQEQENEPASEEKSSALSYSRIEEVVEIPFTKDRGVTKVKCTINDLPLHFVFDTGASDVTMSMVEATFMLKNDYLSPDDFVGTAKYVDANGDVVEGAVINLRHVNFGGLELSNVRASVVRNQKAPLLLGQSVLGRLGKIEIDNSAMKLRISKN